MMKKKYSITQDQFQLLREKLNQHRGSKRFDDENVNAAYLVMVEGSNVMKVAEAYNMSCQNLYRVVRDLWAIFNDVEPPSRVRQRQRNSLKKTPKNWVRVVVTLPPDMAKSVQAMEMQARAFLKQSKDSEKDFDKK